MLINQYSTPNVVQIFSFVGGGLLGFAVLALLAFRCLFAREDPDENDQLIVASAIHLVGTGGALSIGYLLIEATRFYTPLPAAAGFLFAGFEATVVYNLLLLGETFLVRITPLVDTESTG